MFRVRGADGEEYGPASTEQILAWIAENRVDRRSLLRREGELDWQPLERFAEFAGALGNPEDDFAREAARRKVAPAAWGMIISGILGIVWCLIQLMMAIVRGPRANPVLEMLGHRQTEAQAVGFMVGLMVAQLVGLAWAGFVTYAGTRLRQLERRGVVIGAAILMLIPCFGNSLPVCLVSLPLGILALVMVNNAEVRPRFR